MHSDPTIGDGTATPRTLTDPNAPITSEKDKEDQTRGAHDANAGVPAGSTLGKVELDLEKSGKAQKKSAAALSSLPAARKNILTLCFCLSMVSFDSERHQNLSLTLFLASSSTQLVYLPHS